LVYFAARAAYLAVRFDPRVPPDEFVHFGRCELYSKFFLLPKASLQTAPLGLIDSIPYLYYFISGKMLHLNIFGLPDLLFLRLFSVVLGVLTVVYGWLWIREFSKNRIVHVTFAAMVTNTLMFTAMCGSVSYDSMNNLLATATIYYLCLALKRPSANAYLGLGVSIAAGTLTKTSFLPLALVVVLVLLIAKYRMLRAVPTALRELVMPFSSLRAAASALVVLLVALNVAHYGRNLALYGSVAPKAADVMTTAEIMKSPVHAREYILFGYRSGKLSLAQARLLAMSIPRAAVVRDVMYLLTMESQQKQLGSTFKPMSRWQYVVPWAQMIAKSSFGYLGHQSLLKGGWFITPYYAVFGLALILIIAEAVRGRVGMIHIYTLVVVLFYAGVLMQYVNYNAYTKWHFFVIALQGRFIFPVLVPLLGLTVHYSLNPWPRVVQIPLACTMSVLFILGDLPWFLWQIHS
jgi:hypothetical protein